MAEHEKVELLDAIILDWALASRDENLQAFLERMQNVYRPRYYEIQWKHLESLKEPFPLNGEPEKMPI